MSRDSLPSASVRYEIESINWRWQCSSGRPPCPSIHAGVGITGRKRVSEPVRTQSQLDAA